MEKLTERARREKSERVSLSLSLRVCRNEGRSFLGEFRGDRLNSDYIKGRVVYFSQQDLAKQLLNVCRIPFSRDKCSLNERQGLLHFLAPLAGVKRRAAATIRNGCGFLSHEALDAEETDAAIDEFIVDFLCGWHEERSKFS